jgi:DNA-binding beta-propeller fold protein YncE
MRRPGELAAALAGLLALAGASAAGAQAPPPALRTVLRPVTSFWQHLEEGRFRGASGVFYDARHDEVWVADTGNDLVAVFTSDGMPVYTARPGGEVRQPRRIVVDARGRLLVLGADRSRVEELDWRGRSLGPLALPGLPENPTIGTIAVDEQGHLLVGESSAGEVIAYDGDLRVRTRFGRLGNRPGEFLAISGIAARGERIAVVDLRSVCVQVFDRRGNLLFAFGERQIGPQNFAQPAAVVFDSKGRILVVDTVRHEIKLFDERGRFLDRFGGRGMRPGEVLAPRDLAIDGRDRIYVAEGNRIQVLEPVEVPVVVRRPARTTRGGTP